MVQQAAKLTTGVCRVSSEASQLSTVVFRPSRSSDSGSRSTSAGAPYRPSRRDSPNTLKPMA